MLDAYPTRGRRDPRWDKPVVEFMAAVLPWATSERRLALPPPAALVASVDSSLALGCDDPVFLGLAGMLKRAVSPETTEGFDLLRHSVARFRDAIYVRGVAGWFACAFTGSAKGRPDVDRVQKEVDRLALEWLATSLRDGSFLGEDHILAQHCLRDAGDDFFARNPEECARIFTNAGEGVAPWVKHLFVGLDHLRRAWKVRGPGTADRVSPRDMEAFHAGVENARIALTASWTANPARPEAANTLIRVSSVNGGRGGTGRVWFERTLAAQLDYPTSFYALAWHYLPRWGGSHRLILNLGQECAATKRFDTLVPLHLLNAVQLVDYDLDEDGRIFRDPVWRKALDEMLTAYEQEPSQQAKLAYFRSLRAVVAWKSGDYPAAFQILHDLDFRLDSESLRFFPELTVEQVTAQIAYLGGAEKYSVTEAEEKSRRGDCAAARTLLRGIVAVAPASNRAATARTILASMQQTERLEGGAWTKFLPATTLDGWLPGWSVRAGQCAMSGDGTFVGRVGGTGLMVTSDAQVGPDFDVRGEAEINSPTGEGGVVFGGRDFGSDNWCSVRLQRAGTTGGQVILGTQFGTQTAVAAPVQERNAFVVRSWQGRVTVYLNGATVLKEVAPAAPLSRDPDLRVGLGAAPVSGTPSEIHFRRLEIRRLRPE